ncbi:hypothetical protein OS122_29785 [Mycolicibacterium mucogenicum]|uniref:hypothetical protein n=1 Tax=Mycolicibacterium mucogenicum TaxID=56689 RepID=UPI00226A9763|nr:hypothetical protein [Mycolicibacterium mucogenicum]MCX8565078.1 hypothetical protein [Mycolicibacterium mucogenicum]
MRPTVPDVTANLPAVLLGLRWLYDTEQPATAVQDPNGQHLRTPAQRTVHFIPAGAGGHVLIVIQADPDKPDQHTPEALAPGELAAFADLIEDLGETVLSTYNGYPGSTAALALARPAHPTLLTAVARFTDGPHTHDLYEPCQCPWYLQHATHTVGLRELRQQAQARAIDTTALTAAARDCLRSATPNRKAKGRRHIAGPRSRHLICRHHRLT